MHSTDLIETRAYGMNKYFAWKKGEIKYNNMIKQHKMFNFDNITKRDIK